MTFNCWYGCIISKFNAKFSTKFNIASLISRFQKSLFVLIFSLNFSNFFKIYLFFYIKIILKSWLKSLTEFNIVTKIKFFFSKVSSLFLLKLVLKDYSDINVNKNKFLVDCFLVDYVLMKNKFFIKKKKEHIRSYYKWYHKNIKHLIKFHKEDINRVAYNYKKSRKRLKAKIDNAENLYIKHLTLAYYNATEKKTRAIPRIKSIFMHKKNLLIKKNQFIMRKKFIFHMCNIRKYKFFQNRLKLLNNEKSKISKNLYDYRKQLGHMFNLNLRQKQQEEYDKRKFINNKLRGLEIRKSKYLRLRKYQYFALFDFWNNVSLKKINKYSALDSFSFTNFYTYEINFWKYNNVVYSVIFNELNLVNSLNYYYYIFFFIINRVLKIIIYAWDYLK